MDDDPKLDRLTKAIKTLTIAVWCLTALVLGQLAFYGWGFIRSMQWARQAISTTSSSLRQTPPGQPRTEEPDMTELNRFHELPPEDMVTHASVILLTTYQDDGNRNKAVIAEILKRDPEVTLYYSVGDEYPMLSFEKQKDVTCGDGQVVFMVGRRGFMGSSFSFTNGRISGLGDMPLTKLRELVKQNEARRERKS
jgi:hypothetical protein